VNWQKTTFNIPAGTHTLSWRYIKDIGTIAGTDQAWVDEIQLKKFGATYLVDGLVGI
jgi:hypothetical protein